MARSNLPACGLYAITDSALHKGSALEEAVARAIAGGARVIQYRDKSEETDRRRSEAAMLVKICRAQGVPLIVNDDVELAREVDADGVHIGRDDSDLSSARSRLGDDFIIGVSCYDRVALAEAAQANGADYVAFGAMFASTTKPDASRAEIAIFEHARRSVGLPLVAIGGITPDNGASLLAAGADMLAVVTGVFAHEDAEKAARRYAALFSVQKNKEEA